MKLDNMPEDAVRNIDAEQLWFDRLVLAVMNKFQLKGCEKYKIDEVYFKRWLIIDGRVCLFKGDPEDENRAYVARVGLMDGINEYGLPTNYIMVAPNGKTWLRSEEDSSIVWFNSNRIGVSNLIQYYAHKIATCERIEAINIDAQKTPYVINVKPEQARELKRMWEDLKDCRDLVVTSQSVTDNFEAFNLGVPWVAQQISDLKHTYLNDFYTLFGINNTNVEKRAQVQTAEVDSNNDEVSLYLRAIEHSIRDGLRQAQKRCGINIQFDWVGSDVGGQESKTNLSVVSSFAQKKSDVSVDENGGGK